MIEEAMAAYGLAGHPYARRALNPFTQAQDKDLTCLVDGWRTAAEVGTFLAGRAAAKKPALVVIAGGSGTGRTSLAHYLIHKWASGRETAAGVNFSPGNLAIACGRITGYAEDEQFWKWVLELRPQIEDAGCALNEVAEEAFDALEAQMPVAMEAALRKTLRKVVNDLYGKQWALAGIIEDVKTRKFVAMATASFKFVDSLLVMTVDDTTGNFDSVLSNVESALDSEASRLVKLGELDGSEAWEVILTRWTKHTSDPAAPLPFTEESIEKGFNGRRRPVARILKLMERLLTLKARNGGDSDRWPHAQHLKFADDEIAKTVTILDSWLDEGT
ncbi:MAG TPA: hypothetical protein VGL47_43525 [Amycolatopsis sp.]|uniref:hypothetical protein n=1 Tax=Amycolatopsis sp. TaxID=37632 RepID=UPI002F417F5C